jgi:DNA-binding transcriptional MocR family regulator
MFATGKRYQNCIRLNYSYLWNRDIEAALMLLGKIAAAQLA